MVAGVVGQDDIVDSYSVAWIIEAAVWGGGCEVLLVCLAEEHLGSFARTSPYMTAAFKGDRSTLVALRRLWRAVQPA